MLRCATFMHNCVHKHMECYAVLGPCTIVAGTQQLDSTWRHLKKWRPQSSQQKSEDKFGCKCHALQIVILLYTCEQRPKMFMQKPLRERWYGGTCCPNHWKQYGELLKAITWFDGEFERCCCFRSHLGLYSNFICIVLAFVGCESRGSQKA